MKKIISMIMCIMLCVSMFCTHTDVSAYNNYGNEFKDEKGNTYVIYTELNNVKRVGFIKSAKPTNTDTLIIPDVVEHNGTNYKVTTVGDIYKEYYGDTIIDQIEKDMIGGGYKKIIYGKNVDTISSNAHYKNKTLQEVEFTSKKITLDDNAFCECSNLKIIKNSDRIDYCYMGAFAGTGIEEFVVGDYHQGVAAGTFANCKKLKKVTFAKGTSLDTGVFEGCTSLKSINLKKVGWIGEDAFYGCKKLKKIYIGKNTNIIGRYAFDKCSKKLKVQISKKNKYFCSTGTRIYSKNKKKLYFILKYSPVIILPKNVNKLINIPEANGKIKAIVVRSKKFSFGDFPTKKTIIYYPKKSKYKKLQKSNYFKNSKQVAYTSIKIKGNKKAIFKKGKLTIK